MNSNVLHLTGGAEIEATLDNDTEYELVAPITTYSVKDERSNQDGTYTYHHKAKISGPITLIKGNKMIKGKDPKSESRKTRGAIRALQDEAERLDVDEQKFYSEVQGALRRHLHDIYEQYKHEFNF